jgi:adenosylcobinamide-phosphate synthase
VSWLLVALACGLDRLVGDPRWCPHPVVVMGWLISRLRHLAEAWACGSPARLRLAGLLITALLVGGSALAGWALEWLALAPASPLVRAGLEPLGLLLLVIALASALAGRSLAWEVRQVLALLVDPPAARQRLAWIVGRDTDQLSEAEMLRALAETASENGVDGLLAPLFWMLVGAALGHPLALAWAFKAASTLDSMLGYKRGPLRWLGTAGARLDDLLVWLPCRLTLLSLPLVLAPGRCLCQPAWPFQLWRRSLADGALDPSPNAGLSQAAYAHGLGVRLGGANRYAGQWRSKPVLAADGAPPDRQAVLEILRLNSRLAVVWLLGFFITKTLS